MREDIKEILLSYVKLASALTPDQVELEKTKEKLAGHDIGAIRDTVSNIKNEDFEALKLRGVGRQLLSAHFISKFPEVDYKMSKEVPGALGLQGVQNALQDLAYTVKGMPGKVGMHRDFEDTKESKAIQEAARKMMERRQAPRGGSPDSHSSEGVAAPAVGSRGASGRVPAAERGVAPAGASPSPEPRKLSPQAVKGVLSAGEALVSSGVSCPAKGVSGGVSAAPAAASTRKGKGSPARGGEV
jgi:hypothetical protein